MIKELRDYFVKGLEIIDISLSDQTVDNLMAYAKLLIETNKHTNLTAIRDEKELIEKHFLDSMLVHKLLRDDMTSAMDIGTGAGFPGMVLAICNPGIRFTLMDSVGKKTKFLEMVAEELELSNVEVVNERAEEYIKKDDRRESYDLGLCRGVSKLNVILEYMVPFLKVDGDFYALKMEGTGEELGAENALEVLSTEIISTEVFNLPYCKDIRHVIKMKKKDHTDKKYPRRTGMPLKRPL